LRIDKLLGVLLFAGFLQACVAVQEGQTQDEKASAVNVQLGIGYMQQNKLDLASEKLTKALRQDPKSAPVHNAYAILQERLKQMDLAEVHYKEATRLDPKNSQAANNYGAFLCRTGREVESEKYFLQALDNPLYSTPEFAYECCYLFAESGAERPGAEISGQGANREKRFWTCLAVNGGAVDW